MSEIQPCRTCGAEVRLKTVQGEMSLADKSPPLEQKRVCTNRDCRTNGREQSLADVV